MSKIKKSLFKWMLYTLCAAFVFTLAQPAFETAFKHTKGLAASYYLHVTSSTTSTQIDTGRYDVSIEQSRGAYITEKKNTTNKDIKTPVSFKYFATTISTYSLGKDVPIKALQAELRTTRIGYSSFTMPSARILSVPKRSSVAAFQRQEIRTVKYKHTLQKQVKKNGNWKKSGSKKIAYSTRSLEETKIYFLKKNL